MTNKSTWNPQFKSAAIVGGVWHAGPKHVSCVQEEKRTYENEVTQFLNQNQNVLWTHTKMTKMLQWLGIIFKLSLCPLTPYFHFHKTNILTVIDLLAGGVDQIYFAFTNITTEAQSRLDLCRFHKFLLEGRGREKESCLNWQWSYYENCDDTCVCLCAFVNIVMYLQSVGSLSMRCPHAFRSSL